MEAGSVQRFRMFTWLGYIRFVGNGTIWCYWGYWRCTAHGGLEAWELALFLSLQIGKKVHS